MAKSSATGWGEAMGFRKWPAWLSSPLGVTSLVGVLVGVLVFGAEFLLLYVLRAWFAPLMWLEMEGSRWNVINAAVLTLTLAPALYYLVYRKLRASETRFGHANTAMLEAIETLRTREAHLALIHDHASCPLFMLEVEADDRLRFASVNRNFLDTTGLTAERLTGALLEEIVPASALSFVRKKYRESVFSGQPVSWEATADYPAGRKSGVVTIAPVFGADGRCTQLVGTVHDITKCRASERQILHQTRLYATLSQCNEAIVRCTSEQALLQEICRIAVESGGVKLAWVSHIDPDSGARRAIASAGGRSDEFLEGLQIPVAADSPFGGDLVGQAMRESRPVWCEDFLSDPRNTGWHERVARFDLGAAAVLPLRRNGVPTEVMVLFAHAVDAFEPATRRLLVQMAADISFALDNFAREAAGRQALDELRESEQRYRCLIEQSIAGVYLIQDGKMRYVNPYMAEMLGYTAGELIDRDPLLIVAEKDRGTVAENIRLRLEGDVDQISYTFTATGKDGRETEVGAHGARASFHGRPAIVGLIQDITDKVHAEQRIKQHLEELEAAFMSTVRVATNLSELRDAYTQGHSRRVGEIAAAIGAELGFDDRRQQGLRVAGSLHDIGKISIPLQTLTTPEPLTTAQWALIHQHPQAGYEILQGIELPWPVAAVAWQHHERMDGSGYPCGLRGEAILLESRIVMVADVVESMATRRPYRAELGITLALAEIERGCGSLFDVEVVDACLRLFREKDYALPA
jgi:PAS domain S-box-containing protein